MKRRNEKRKALPEQALLLDLLSYDTETGMLIWKARSIELGERFGFTKQSIHMWNAKYAGSPASSSLRKGYVGVTIFGEKYFAHRVIWKMSHGVDPDHIDHINGVTSDNRLVNIRNVDASGNQQNRKISKNSASGVPGVNWCKSTKAWVARIRVGGKRVALGRFQSFSDAVSVRRDAEKHHGFHENHGSR